LGESARCLISTFKSPTHRAFGGRANSRARGAGLGSQRGGQVCGQRGLFPANSALGAADEMHQVARVVRGHFALDRRERILEP
jgi:hypothetical protein